MAINQWFKFYGGEYLSDPKIELLQAQERSIWITLLSLASISSTPGVVEYLTIEVLLKKAGIEFNPYTPEEWNSCLGILTKFEKMKMIKTYDNGSIEIINWNKRQETALTGYERVKRYRQKNKMITNDNDDNENDNDRKEKIRIDKNINTEKEEPQADEPPALSKSKSKKEISEEDIEKIFISYKQLIHGSAILGAMSKQKIKDRLKDYSVDDIWAAMYAKSKDNWWTENNNKRGMTWFFENKKRIEKYIEEGYDKLKSEPEKIFFGKDEQGRSLYKLNPFVKKMQSNN